jgi:hypothetical protein
MALGGIVGGAAADDRDAMAAGEGLDEFERELGRRGSVRGKIFVQDQNVHGGILTYRLQSV